MKTASIIKKKSKITKILDNTFKNTNNIVKTKLKKILNIIFQYNTRGKKILFVNVPTNIIKNFKKQKFPQKKLKNIKMAQKK